MSDKMFHMPIARGSFFNEDTHAAISRFLDAGYMFQSARIVAMITNFRVSKSSFILDVVPHFRLTLLSQTEDGRVQYCDPAAFVEPDLRRAFAEIAAAWVVDDCVSDSAADCLPFASGIAGQALDGEKMYSHIQTSSFALYGRAHPSSAAEQYGANIAGPDALLDLKGFFMNLILPPIATAHDTISEVAAYGQIEDLARHIYDHQMEGCAPDLPLAPFDFGTIRVIDEA